MTRDTEIDRNIERIENKFKKNFLDDINIMDVSWMINVLKSQQRRLQYVQDHLDFYKRENDRLKGVPSSTLCADYSALEVKVMQELSLKQLEEQIAKRKPDIKPLLVLDYSALKLKEDIEDSWLTLEQLEELAKIGMKGIKENKDKEDK